MYTGEEAVRRLFACKGKDPYRYCNVLDVFASVLLIIVVSGKGLFVSS